ncbi:MAG TPA: tetratricopeptide repeat protein, partial [Gammaproteobacteria bacterium]|nr:tetratricopeptide repeat protein [Gammaproteobacteria bacterium]
RLQALYELGCDYMRAGVLDRAENLFVEVAEEAAWAEQALWQLLDIYQQEKDWPNAIATARRLRDSVGPAMGKVIAQYHCELADEARSEPDLPKATRLIKRALQEDPDCVRASLMEAELLLAQDNPKAAIRALKRVERQDPGFLPETIGLLQEAYRALGRPLELMHYLRQLLREHGGTTILNALVQLMRQQQGDRDAALFLADYLKKNPSVRGMERLIELKAAHSADSSVRDELEILRGLAMQLAETKPAYRCENCGFEGRTLHWQCPSCKQWARIKHIHSVDID